MAFFPDTNLDKEFEGGYAHSTMGQFHTGGLGNKNIWLGKNNYKKELKKQKAIFEPLIGQAQSLYGSASADQLRALADVKRGYKSARGRVSAVQHASTRGLSVAQGAAAKSDAASASARGLSTQGVSRASGADAGRVRAHIASSLTALRASMALGETSALVGAYNDIAGLQETFSRQQTQIEIDRMEAYRGIYNGRGGGLLKPVLTTVGTVFGAWFGGSGGGAAGGSAGAMIGDSAEKGIK